MKTKDNEKFITKTFLETLKTETPTPKPPVVLTTLEDLRLPHNFTQMNAIEALPVGASLRKPHKNAWIRTHPAWSFSCRLLETGDGRQKELHVVHPKLHAELSDDIRDFVCVPYVDREGCLSFWPLRLPSHTRDLWASSAITIAEHAKTKWVRVKTANSQYEAKASLSMKEDPDWDLHNLDASFSAAIADTLISSMDHPAVRNLSEAA